MGVPRYRRETAAHRDSTLPRGRPRPGRPVRCGNPTRSPAVRPAPPARGPRSLAPSPLPGSRPPRRRGRGTRPIRPRGPLPAAAWGPCGGTGPRGARSPGSSRPLPVPSGPVGPALVPTLPPPAAAAIGHPVPCPPPSASSSLSLLLLLSAPSASHRPDDRPSGQERLAARRAPARGSPASHLRTPGARGGQQPSGMATARIGARSGLRRGAPRGALSPELPPAARGPRGA